MATQLRPKDAAPPITRIDAHYRKFLATRWLGLVIRAAVVTSLSLFLVPGILISWNYSFLSALATLVLAGPLLYLTSVHLVLRVRRSWIISPPVLPAQPSDTSVIVGTFAPRTLVLLAVHWAFGTVFALAYAFVLNARSPSVALGWFNSTQRHQWHGNERLWFLVLGNTLFFGGIALRDVLSATLGPVWPKTRMRFPDAIARSLKACFGGYRADSTFGHDVSLALSWTAAYSAVYFVLRRWAWRWAATNFAIIRPFVINFAKSSRTNVTWSLSWHLFVLQLTCLFALKPALAVIDDYLTQPLNFASFTSKSPLSPDHYLLTALESKNEFYIDHTIVELRRVAHTKARRVGIFADTSKPALTHELWAALLLQLGASYTTLVNRGATPKAKKAAPPTAPARPDPHSIALKTADIFRPAPKRTGIQALVGGVLDGTPQPTPAPVLAVAESARRAEASLFTRVEAPAHAAEQWAAGTPVLGPLVSAAKIVSGGYKHWAGAEWARRSVQAAVPEFDRLKNLIDILTTLAVASADEDTYGYVQAVLPSALEAFVRVRAAALSLGTELLAQAPKVAPDAEADVRAQIAPIVDALDGGVTRIVERFGNSLTAFKFPSEIAAALGDVCRDDE